MDSKKEKITTMAYLTLNELSSKTFIRANVLNESISGIGIPVKKRVFLSYRRQDKNYVNDIVRFLKGLGVSIYVDYLDETLEEKTNQDVAKILRNRINDCTKFISLASPNSGASKWMPWELGLGDRIINYPNVAVLPLTTSVNYWPDQEYGKIYGKVENIASVGFRREDTWYIIYPDNTRINFKTWLQN